MGSEMCIRDSIGDVEGKTALVVDDFTISGGTLCEVAEELMSRGARSVHVAVTHGVFSEGSMERISRSQISSLIMTNSVEKQQVDLCEKVDVVSVAPLFGEAIRRIHNRESISDLFEHP